MAKRRAARRPNLSRLFEWWWRVKSVAWSKTAGVLLVGLAALALTGAFIWLRATGPSDGARLEPGRPAWRPQGVLLTPFENEPGGLREGDLLVAVDGRSLE